MKRLKRLTKRKIRGKELENLAKIFGITKETLYNAPENWLNHESSYGQLNTKVKNDSIELELELNQYFSTYGNKHSELSFLLGLSKTYSPRYRYSLKKTIK